MAAALRIAALACALLVAAPSAAQQGEAVLTELPPQSLQAGACGMFLWSRGPQPAFVFVAYDTPAVARIAVSGRTIALRRTAFTGERVSGHFERQTFSDGSATVEADVRFDLDRPIRDGAIIGEGVLRLVSPGGWQTVTPVGGMVACQT